MDAGLKSFLQQLRGFPSLEAGEPLRVCGSSVAIVGNSGVLRRGEYGSLIDSHDIVIRFGEALIDGYVPQVGSKTTIRVTNTHFLKCLQNDALDRDMAERFSSWDREFYFKISGQCIIIKKDPGQDISSYFPYLFRIQERDNLVMFVSRELVQVGEHIAKKHPTCGLLGLLLGLQIGSKINCFGFTFYKESWEEKHYYETMKPYNVSQYHDPAFEEQFFRLMSDAGAIQIHN